jgi:hypothetical protein
MVHILQMETDMSIPRYAYHKPSTVSFRSKCEWQNGLNPDSKGGLVWYPRRSKTNKSIGIGVYKWTQEGGIASDLDFHQ